MKHISSNMGSKLEALAQRAQATLELADIVRNALADPEKTHVVSASYREATLVVLMDSAAWCAQIRLGQRELLATVNRTSEMQFTKLKVRVSAPAAAATSQTR
jgi:hypothetical protein